MVASQTSQEHTDDPLFELGVPILQKHYDAMQSAMENPPHDMLSVAESVHSISGLELYAMAYSFKRLLEVNIGLQEKLDLDEEVE